MTTDNGFHHASRYDLEWGDYVGAAWFELNGEKFAVHVRDQHDPAWAEAEALKSLADFYYEFSHKGHAAFQEQT